MKTIEYRDCMVACGNSGDERHAKDNSRASTAFPDISSACFSVCYGAPMVSLQKLDRTGTCSISASQPGSILAAKND